MADENQVETLRREMHELIAGVHGRIDTVHGRIDSVHGRIDRLEQRVDERVDGVNLQIEGVHDHIRLVAESAASQSEGIIRKIDEMNALNRADHETFKNVLANHESRIATPE